MPSNLIRYPCEPIGPGSTYETLAKAYVINTSCIGAYRGIVDGIYNYNIQFDTEITREDEKNDSK